MATGHVANESDIRLKNFIALAYVKFLVSAGDCKVDVISIQYL